MRIQANEPLQARNTLSLKASARAFVRINDEPQLIAALDWAAQKDMDTIILGEGSNVVLAGDIDALVIEQGLRGIDVLEDNDDCVVLKVAAGENWHALVEWTLNRGYYGLENLALIPGTVGAAPIQNIGAYGVEFSSFVRTVYAIQTSDGQPISLNAAECEFGYRDSVFKNSLRDTLAITAVELVLRKEASLQFSYPSLSNYLSENNLALSPQTIFDAVVSIRRSRLPDPAVLANAGSFFKNPVISADQARHLRETSLGIPCYPQVDGKVKIAAAWLIDQCGWKGERRGAVGVHPEHALVLVNYDCSEDSGGAQVLALAGEIQQSVFRDYNIQLEIEPRVYGV